MKKVFTTVVMAAATLIAGATEFKYEALPAPGQVNDFEEVSVIFDIEGLDEIEINSKDDITISKDGVVIEGTKATIQDKVMLVVTAPQRYVEAGEYVVSIPAYSICSYMDEYENFAILENDINIVYTIGGGSASVGNLELSFNPASGSTLSSLKEIVVSSAAYPNLECENKDGVTVTRDGEAISDWEIVNNNGNSFTFRFTEEQSVSGEYVVTFPLYSLLGYNDEDSMPNLQDVTLSYTVEGTDPGEMLQISVNPESGIVTSLKDIVISTESFPYIECGNTDAVYVEKDGETITDWSIIMSDGNDFVFSFNEEQTEPGEYKVVFPAYSILGWNDESNACNMKDIVLTYTIREAAPEVTYSLSLTFSNPRPNADGEIDITERDVTFMSFLSDMPGLKPAEDATITMECVEVGYKVTVPLTGGSPYGDKTMFKATFGEEPVYNGTYVITVAKGSFGDENWILDPATGVSNADVELSFKVVGGEDFGVGVDAIESENGSVEIYNFQGVRMNAGLEELPAGLYIVNGKKVVKK